jgi:hypothetical protein
MACAWREGQGTRLRAQEQGARGPVRALRDMQQTQTRCHKGEFEVGSSQQQRSSNWWNYIPNRHAAWVWDYERVSLRGATSESRGDTT